MAATRSRWTDHGWGIRVTTPDQVFRLIGRIALLQNNRTYAWRGQNDDSYLFSSSLYRLLAKLGPVTETKMREKEKEILTEARRWGLGRDLGASATDLHLLGSLQHHGVPTRLIDVTSDPMTALWFATEVHEPDKDGKIPRPSGVLFAIDVTDTDWYESFDHGSSTQTYGHLKDAQGATYEHALKKSQTNRKFFRAYSALPDERMKAQQGYFLGSAVPNSNRYEEILGVHINGPAPGEDRLKKLMSSERGPGRPATLPFCALVIPATVQDKLRDPLKRTFNRRPRVLFPDVDGFRDALARGQLD